MERTQLNFGDALAVLKVGGKVARKGWNGKRMFLYLTSNSIVSFDKLNFAAHTHITKESTGRNSAYINPHIDMKAADGTITIGWALSQVDMLAEDWEVVE